MIGAFDFSETPDYQRAVVVELGLALDGARMGHTKLAPVCFETLTAQEAHPLREPYPVEAAFSYAVFFAMKYRLPLVVTGDPSAWDPMWGVLTTREHLASIERRAVHNAGSDTKPRVG